MEYTVGARLTPDGMQLWIGGLGQRDASSGDRLMLQTPRQQLTLSSPSHEVDAGDGTIVRTWQVPYAPPSEESVRLFVNAQCVAEARVVPVPSALTGQLRVLLGSCFNIESPAAGAVAKTVQGLRRELRPDLQFLCGDQVYLDPLRRRYFTPFPKAADDVRRIVDVYRRSWWGPDGLAGLLQACPAVFCPDDHDLWDDYRTDCTPRSRRKWRALALQLLDVVQTPDRWHTFDVAPLSFAVIDTRRDRNGDEFMTEALLERTLSWLQQLRGPGVLVVGQPLFGEPWRPFRLRAGRDLPDYSRQYRRLASALLSAPHSVVVLSGDVHWGRVSTAGRRPDGAVQVAEVLSSPLAISNSWSRWLRAWIRAPRTFPPARCVRPRAGTTTDRGYEVQSNHFALITFETKGSHIQMNVAAHPTDGSAPVLAQSLLLS